jgi:hypothetical protein
MATTGRADTEPPSSLADRICDAGFVQLSAAPAGDALGAAALLAETLETVETPYQLSVVTPTDGLRATDAELTIAVGHKPRGADAALDGHAPLSRRAYTIATDVGGASPVLAAAGAIAAGTAPAPTALGESDEPTASVSLERRAGLGSPPVAPADGLAHSTLLHTSLSGRPDRAAELLNNRLPAAASRSEPKPESGSGSEHDHVRRRTVASMAALTVAAEASTPAASTAVERALRPLTGGPLGTAAGLGDVLDVLADSDPGLAVAAALGHADESAVLSAWRTGATRVHDAVRDADLTRHDGVVVARTTADPPIAPVARLCREYRSPEPTVVVATESSATAVTTPGDGPDLAEATGQHTDVAGTTDRVRCSDPTATETIVDTIREAL